MTAQALGPGAALDSTRERRAPEMQKLAADAVAPVAANAAAGGGAPAAPSRADSKSAVQAPEPRRSLLFPAPVALSEVVVTSVPANRIDALAGCYPAPEATGLRAAIPAAAAAVNRVAQGAPSSAQSPSQRAARARAEAPAEERAGYSGPSTTKPMLRLDTLQQPLGYLVKAVPSDSNIGWWRDVSGDSARVDLLARGVFTIARKDRVKCPER
jgi:hypothetical protein